MPGFCPPRPDYLFRIDLVARYRPCRIYLYICRTFAHYLRSNCPHSLMDRISDSGSDGCGSIPHEGTKKDFETKSFLIVYDTLTKNCQILCQGVSILLSFAWFGAHLDEKTAISLPRCVGINIFLRPFSVRWPPPRAQRPETEPRSCCHTCRTP